MESWFLEKLNRRNVKRLLNVLLWCAIGVYLFVMADLLLFKIPPSQLFSRERYILRPVNLIPLVSIFEYLFGNVASSKIAIHNVFGNVLIFMPMGLLLQLMRPKQSLPRTVMVVCLTSIAVEAVQFILAAGSADIDDVILNTLGGLLGALMFTLMKRFIKNPAIIRPLVSIIAALCAVVVIAAQGKVWIKYYFHY